MATPGVPAPATPASTPLSKINIPGTNIPADAAIAYAGAVATEIANANVVTDPKIQAVLHFVAVVLVAIGHGLHTDGV